MVEANFDIMRPLQQGYSRDVLAILDDLNIALPVSSIATQHTDFTGNWSREKTPQQRDISVGKWTRQSREGRTGHDYTLSFNAH